MPPPTRITIRLPPDLATRLVAHGGPLADIVRQALEAYLGGDTAPGLPHGSQLAATPAAMADMLSPMADSMAAMEARLENFTPRVTALEATAATADRLAQVAARLAQMADSVAAIEAHVGTLEARVTAIEAASANGSQRLPGRQPAQEPPQAARGDMRRRILALLQDHPEGLSPAELRRRLAVDRDLNNTCFAMARDGLLKRVGRGRYAVA